jgi:Protein of unknown function (DUF2934)
MEDEISRRAYELWEQYGRPDSGEEEFWLKAEREIKQAKGLDRTIPEPSKTASDRQEKASPRKNDTRNPTDRLALDRPASKSYGYRQASCQSRGCSGGLILAGASQPINASVTRRSQCRSSHPDKPTSTIYRPRGLNRRMARALI